MSIESNIQDYYFQMLEKYSIDFVHLKNKGQKLRGKYSHGIFKGGADNNKYFPDLIFPFMGKIFMREFGEKGKHSERKEKQAMRLHHWGQQGNADILIVYDMETARKDWKYILKDKFMEIE